MKNYQPGGKAHEKKQDHKNTTAYQYIIFYNAGDGKIMFPLWCISDLNRTRNMKTIRYHNPCRIGGHGYHNRPAFLQGINMHSIHH